MSNAMQTPESNIRRLHPRPLTADEQTFINDVLMAATVLRPYYGRALAALTPVAAPGLNTVAVDYYWRLYVDVDWLRAQTDRDQALLVAAHEIEHLIRGHDRLCQLADRCTCNLAADAEINDDDSEVIDMAQRHGAVLPSLMQAPDHLLAEDYIRYLHALAQQPQASCGGGSGAGAPLEGELGEDGQGSDGQQHGKGVDPVRAEQIRDAVAEDIRKEAETNPGSIPEHLRIWADERAKRYQVRWPVALRTALGTKVTAGVGTTSWRRLHRRWRHGDPLRPSNATVRPKIGIGVDTSGSMQGLGAEVLGVVESVARTAGDIVVVQGDCGITAKPTSRLPKNWVGGGGTDPAPILAALDKAKVDTAVIVTDGECHWPASAPAAHLVIVIVGSSPMETPPYATVVRVG